MLRTTLNKARALIGMLCVIATVVAAQRTSHAQTDHCFLLAEPTVHPETFREIEECVDCDWKLWAFATHCCLPGCTAFRECTITRVAVEEGWEELWTCDYDTPEEFFTAYLGGELDPGALDPTLVELYADARALADGEPIPQGLMDLLLEIGRSPLVDGLDFLSADQLSQILLVPEADVSWKGASLGDTILLAEDRFDVLMNNPAPSFEEFACQWNIDADEFYQDAFHTLVHELVHTMQFHAMGGTSYYAQALWGISIDANGPLEDDVKEWTGFFWENVESRVACSHVPPEEQLIVDEEPSATSLRDLGLAIYADSYLKLNDRAEIRSQYHDLCTKPNGQIFDCYQDVGTGGAVYIGTDSRIQGLASNAGANLRDRSSLYASAVVSGSVALGNDVTIGGLCVEGAGTISSRLQMFQPQFPAFTTTVAYMPPDSNWILAPGAYQALTVTPRSTMHFTAGTYYFDQLVSESTSNLVFDTSQGPIRIFVQSSMIHRGDMLGDAGEILLANMSDSNLHLEGEFTGTLIAPNAAVAVQSRNTSPSHTGSIVAGLVEVHQDTHWHFSPFRYPWLP